MVTKRILLVDDEEELLEAMKIRLVSWGYDVVTATTGEEAVSFAQEKNKPLDAIILDIMMPGIGGIEALRRIRAFNKKLPVFILTAYSSEESFKEAESLGISGYIPKGSEFANASEAIRVVLKGAA